MHTLHISHTHTRVVACKHAFVCYVCVWCCDYIGSAHTLEIFTRAKEKLDTEEEMCGLDLDWCL